MRLMRLLQLALTARDSTGDEVQTIVAEFQRFVARATPEKIIWPWHSKTGRKTASAFSIYKNWLLRLRRRLDIPVHDAHTLGSSQLKGEKDSKTIQNPENKNAMKS